MKPVKLTQIDVSNATNRRILTIYPGPGLWYRPAESGLGTQIGGFGIPVEPPTIVSENTSEIDRLVVAATQNALPDRV